MFESASNTSITGNASARGVDATTFNAASADDALFDYLTVDGITKNRHKSRILVSASDNENIAYVEAANAMTKEINGMFDDSLTISQTAGVFTVTDAQGRALVVGQGDGTGYFFGSDIQNSGPLETQANMPNGLSVKWDESDLVISHRNGGGVDMTNFTSSGLGTAIFDVSDTATSAIKEPITFRDSATSTTASVKGIIGESRGHLNFSNTFGYADDNAGTSNSGLAARIWL